MGAPCQNDLCPQADLLFPGPGAADRPPGAANVADGAAHSQVPPALTLGGGCGRNGGQKWALKKGFPKVMVLAISCIQNPAIWMKSPSPHPPISPRNPLRCRKAPPPPAQGRTCTLGLQKKRKLKRTPGDFLYFLCRGIGLIPGWGTKIPPCPTTWPLK